MANGNGKNGMIWKSLVAAGALVLTIALTLLASGRSSGRQEEKVAQLEKDTATQQVKIDCHEKEIATLKAQWSAIEKQLGEQDRKLSAILDRLPARGP